LSRQGIEMYRRLWKGTTKSLPLMRKKDENVFLIVQDRSILINKENKYKPWISSKQYGNSDHLPAMMK
jgi:hypothetical protein